MLQEDSQVTSRIYKSPGVRENSIPESRCGGMPIVLTILKHVKCVSLGFFFQTPWLWNTRHCWYNYPYQVRRSDFWGLQL